MPKVPQRELSYGELQNYIKLVNKKGDRIRERRVKTKKRFVPKHIKEEWADRQVQLREAWALKQKLREE